MTDKSLQLITVDKEKCVNCHKCIAVCPVKFCNDGSGDHVRINSKLCIACGACIKACTHNARIGVDDYNDVFHSLKYSGKLIAIVAPAVAANFPNEYLKLNGLLKSMGFKAIFDASFGAELTVKSYIEYHKENEGKLIIAQPCAAIVNYIELYKPDLITSLAPLDSPIMHTAKMIREQYPEYDDSNIVAITPCYAKKQEFVDTGNLIKYNLTFKSIKDYIQINHLNLSDVPEEEYENPSAERAVSFSSPGGLTKTIERETKELNIKRIEGPSTYKYLTNLSDSNKLRYISSHDIIDCLNCEAGCNGGPAAINTDQNEELLEYQIDKRSKNLIEKYLKNTVFKSVKSRNRKLNRLFNKYWNKYDYKTIFKRSYINKSDISKCIKIPSTNEINKIYKNMYKKSERDILNCGACGYGNCNDMVIAIYNNLNKVENCKLYMERSIELSNKKHKEELVSTVNNISDKSVINFKEKINSMSWLINHATEMSNCVIESSSAVEEMIANINSINGILNNNDKTVLSLIDSSNNGQREISTVTNLIDQLNKKSEMLSSISDTIKDTADQTNILAMNAAIEASHAGSFGKGFAVVANEIRNLAEHASKESVRIDTIIKELRLTVASQLLSSNNTVSQFKEILDLINQVKNEESVIKSAITEQSAGGKQITEALSEMNTLVITVRDEINNLNNISQAIVQDLKRLKEINI